MKKQLYCVALLLLTVCQTPVFAQATLSNTPGALHNEGVQFILQNIRTIPSSAEIGPLVIQFTTEFCVRTDLDCSFVTLTSLVPPTNEQLLATIKGSQKFKNDLGLMFQLMDNIRPDSAAPGLSLHQYEISLTDLQTTVAENLAGNEQTEFLAAISIARMSALLWAPVEEGGINGSGFLNSFLGIKINWGKAVGADVGGFFSGLFKGGGLRGGVANAIASSASNVLGQVLEQLLITVIQ